MTALSPSVRLKELLGRALCSMGAHNNRYYHSELACTKPDKWGRVSYRGKGKRYAADASPIPSNWNLWVESVCMRCGKSRSYPSFYDSGDLMP